MKKQSTVFACDMSNCNKTISEVSKGFPYEAGWRYLYKLEFKNAHATPKNIIDKHFCSNKHLSQFVFAIAKQTDPLHLPSAKTFKAKFLREHPICNRCPATTNLTIEHIIPLSKGGKKTKDNWQVLCKPCNMKKGAKV